MKLQIKAIKGKNFYMVEYYKGAECERSFLVSPFVWLAGICPFSHPIDSKWIHYCVFESYEVAQKVIAFYKDCFKYKCSHIPIKLKHEDLIESLFPDVEID